MIVTHAALRSAPPVVPETRFGRWFLGTQVWTRYVVEAAFAQFLQQLPAEARRPRRILDAGCGAGVSVPLLAQHFSPETILAMDIDPGEVERSRRRLRRSTHAVQFMVGDAARLSLAAGSFDMVLCHQLLHHTRSQREVLGELHRVLAPGGWLLLAESCREFIRTPAVRVMFRHPNDAQRSAAEFQQLVRDAGFTFGAAQVQTSTPFWSLPDWGLARRLGWRASAPLEPTQVTLVAAKPR